MGVFPRCAAVKRPTGPVERHAGPCEPLGQHLICERHDLMSGRMNIAMHISDEMPDTGCLCDVARMCYENVFIGCTDDIGGFGIVVEKLPWMKNRAGWQFEREDDPIRRFNEASNATAIDRAHWKFDNR